MANTLIPIQTYTLTGSTASVTFSNIPQNYTDLKIVASTRGDTGSGVINLSFNGVTTNLSGKTLYGSGSAVASGSPASTIPVQSDWSNATASTFGNVEFYIPNYTSSNYKSVSADAVAENNATEGYNWLTAGLWSSTAAITSVTLTSNSSNFVSGSTFTLYGISNGVKATGGTLTVAGGYAYHTFTSTGSFLPNQRIKGAEVLVIGGGASGGRGRDTGGDRAGGGGGAGGLLYLGSQTLNAGTSYTALVGAGGAAVTVNNSSGNVGNSSVFNNQTALYGGVSAYPTSIVTGGSGGGGECSGGVILLPGLGTSGQGNNGGNAYSPNNGASGGTNDAGGGGGGAGAVGGNASSASSGTGGAGGAGSSTYTTWHSITGTGVLSGGVYYIAGGGGGSGYGVAGVGGIGGGGAGAIYSGAPAGTAGTSNTGGGGGGSSNAANSGAGGSGLIIVRYPLS